MTKDELKLPAFNYFLDESDPDIAVLRREDGSFVAAFSARGATREGIREAAMEDYRALVEAHRDFLDSSARAQRQGGAKPQYVAYSPNVV
jgi:hypothetical protein